MINAINPAQNRQVAFQGRTGNILKTTGSVLRYTKAQIGDTIVKGFGPSMMAGISVFAAGADAKFSVITAVFTAMAAKLNHDGVTAIKASLKGTEEELSRFNLFKNFFKD